MKKELKAGKSILGHCAKCKLDLEHTIVSMVEGNVAKVKCNTCGSGPKNFRPVKPKKGKTPVKRVTKKKASTKPLSFATAVGADVDLWQEKMNKSNNKPETNTYAPKSSYAVDDIIDHKQFGVGFIDKTINNKRIEVLFKDGRKLLVMNYKA